jgi:hypothetical protein
MLSHTCDWPAPQVMLQSPLPEQFVQVMPGHPSELPQPEADTVPMPIATITTRIFHMSSSPLHPMGGRHAIVQASMGLSGGRA